MNLPNWNYKRFVLVGVGVAILFFLGGRVIHYVSDTMNAFPPPPPTVVPIEYKNKVYGFGISLPDNWKGFAVITDRWSGYAVGGESGQTLFAEGPSISIRNPQWTAAIPYQDIPIMVFTLKQWEDLQADKFHIGAAPIGPSELNRNGSYVFALPARYNFAYPAEYEEVDHIIQGKPLKTFPPETL